MAAIRVVHYLNQFFGQIGGEEAAGAGPQIKPGAIGPGKQLEKRLGPDFVIVATAICGDNAFADHPEPVASELVSLIRSYEPQILIAGPAFNSGRYGQSCGLLCAATQDELGIPVLTGMHEENPAVEQFRSRMPIVRTGATARYMGEALERIGALAARIARGEEITRPAEAGCFAAGLKRPVMREHNAAERAIEILLSKLAGQPFTTEMSRPSFERVAPATLATDLSKATVALVTDGGLVARGNPERMPNGYTDRMTSIPIAGMDRLTAERVEVHHGGYDTHFVNADTNRLVPLDAMRELEREGAIGKLYEVIYSTAGLGMSLSNARKLGREIAIRLRDAGVHAAILTST